MSEHPTPNIIDELNAITGSEVCKVASREQMTQRLAYDIRSNQTLVRRFCGSHGMLAIADVCAMLEEGVFDVALFGSKRPKKRKKATP